VNPISKTNWEGAGVEPDVPVKAADALEKAEELAASKLAHRSEKLAQTSLRLYSI
jgi:C-terminal processing protease CtpA/Prc